MPVDRRHRAARDAGPQRGQRLFGFKAHFEGPMDDAVELFFFERCYVGVTGIEEGKTNVCGLAPESFLSRFGFEYDGIVMHCPALSDRLKPLRRVTPWFSTGPLQYGQAFDNAGSQAYPAGDALSFVDPFTGSGLLAAVRSGAMAGRAAAIGTARGGVPAGMPGQPAAAVSGRRRAAPGAGRRMGGKTRSAGAFTSAVCSDASALT